MPRKRTSQNLTKWWRETESVAVKPHFCGARITPCGHTRTLSLLWMCDRDWWTHCNAPWQKDLVSFWGDMWISEQSVLGHGTPSQCPRETTPWQYCGPIFFRNRLNTDKYLRIWDEFYAQPTRDKSLYCLYQEDGAASDTNPGEHWPTCKVISVKGFWWARLCGPRHLRNRPRATFNCGERWNKRFIITTLTHLPIRSERPSRYCSYSRKALQSSAVNCLKYTQQ